MEKVEYDSDGRGRYRCEEEENCSRCDDRYKNSSYRRDTGKSREEREKVWYTGMSRYDIDLLDTGVFLNEEQLRNSEDLGQVAIVDSGCPRSLMGHQQLDKLKELVEVKIFTVRDEGFRFGPSKIYKSCKKAKITMRMGMNEMNCEFFVLKGNIPILLGNDIMVPNGGKIDMEENILFLSKVDMEIPLHKTNGGHFVIPMKNVAGLNANNIKGEEADAVMWMVLENVEDEAIKRMHDEIGHTAFLALALTSDEDVHVKKVHRYFGHRSARRVWELFSKAKKLKGKKQAVLEVINNCKTCSQYKKAPPRPKVGMPVANTFNEVVGLDLKVLSKTKGEYIRVCHSPLFVSDYISKYLIW